MISKDTFKAKHLLRCVKCKVISYYLKPNHGSASNKVNSEAPVFNCKAVVVFSPNEKNSKSKK
jgi:hypothetical protein